MPTIAQQMGLQSTGAQPKEKRWQSKRYIDWIKKQTCAVCGAPAEPHHIKGIGHMSGTALKAPDWAVSPLCHPCHDSMHHRPSSEQWEIIARTLGKAIQEGVLK